MQSLTTPRSVLAEALWEAERSRVPISPLSEIHAGITVEDAYAVQGLNLERRLTGGARLLGRKVGLTAKAMQQMLEVDEPDYGALMDDMFIEEGDTVDLGTLIAPRIEGELAFVLGHDLIGPGVTAVAAARAVAGVTPALEIIDSRIANWKITLADTVADNASCGRVMLSGGLTSIDGLDLRLIGMALERNGEIVETGAGAAVLGNPLRCVAWLANKLAQFGEGLRAGDVVLAGALHRAVELHAGDVIRAEFAHLGAVTAHFENIGGSS